MNFKFECPHCGQRIRAEYADAGTEGICPTCNSGFNVPDAMPDGDLKTEDSVASPPAAGDVPQGPSKRCFRLPHAVILILVTIVSGFGVFLFISNTREAEIQLKLGLAYSTGRGVTRDDEKAVECFTKAAKHGSAEAQYNLGAMYTVGRGVEKDFKEAFGWLTKAAEKGHAGAQGALGRAYKYELGVAQDYTKAVEWFTKAAKHGDDLSQTELGTAYSLGQGVPQDDIQAVEWWMKAAQKGDALAQYSLGVAYTTGTGVKLDQGEAFKWFSKSAEQGHPEAQSSIGARYYLGQGVTRDLNKALHWLTKAEEGGSEEAKELLANLEASRDASDESGKASAGFSSKAVQLLTEAAQRGEITPQMTVDALQHAATLTEEQVRGLIAQERARRAERKVTDTETSTPSSAGTGIPGLAPLPPPDSDKPIASDPGMVNSPSSSSPSTPPAARKALELKVGDEVQTVHETMLTFDAKPFSRAAAGQHFEVFALRPIEKRVYLRLRTSEGKDIAVAVEEDSVEFVGRPNKGFAAPPSPSGNANAMRARVAAAKVAAEVARLRRNADVMDRPNRLFPNDTSNQQKAAQLRAQADALEQQAQASDSPRE